METERSTHHVRNAASHSYQPAKYLRDDQEDVSIPVVSDSGLAEGSYEPLPTHVQE